MDKAVSVAVRALPRPWETRRDANGSVWSAGCLQEKDRIAESAGQSGLAELGRRLADERQQFGLIIETDAYFIAASDRVNGFPLAVRRSGSCIEVAADTRCWMTPDNGDQFDEQQAEIFTLAGYCVGNRTLLRNVTRILPGEVVRISKRSGEIERHRYYRFAPTFSGTGSDLDWLERLGTALDAATERMLAQADGRRIWIPLSAGYDSRLVLAKLLEHGCKNVQTFSYGTPGNMEARVAQSLAESVGVPWRFVPPDNAADANDYWSGDAAQYAFFAGGTRTTPVLNEFFAFRSLLRAGELDQGDLITNGQTGDFVSGGHIPKVVPTSSGDVSKEIRQKHLGLFRALSDKFGQSGTESLLADWIETSSDGNEPAGEYGAARIYLTFEWQERQCQLVVNQQRACDYLGLDWTLPLWDGDVMDLFEVVPFDLQYKQKLYTDYLQTWNYRGLFSTLRLPYNPWPRGRSLILLLGRLAGVVGGAEAKEMTYRRFYYFTDYHYLYALFGWRCYDAMHRDLRTPASLMALSHLVRLRRVLGIDMMSPLERQFANLMGTRLNTVPSPV